MKKALLAILIIIACDKSVTTKGQQCGGEIIGGYCYGCTDPNACNWDSGASRFDNSCTYIPEGACDCAGEVYDCLGVCGGTAIVDVCDVCGGEGAIYQCGCTDILAGYCDCDGNINDECGVCGGEGAIYQCGCTDILAGYCDCDGNINDACGECGGTNNYAPNGCEPGTPGCVLPDGSCDCDGNVFDCAGFCAGDTQLDAIGICGGTCTSDINDDGVCDD